MTRPAQYPWMRERRPAGFSLLELMIVIAVLGIVVSLAVPGYRQQLLRSHRVAVIGQMLRVADCQERVYATRQAYDMGMCLPQPDARYALEIGPAGDDIPGGYLILARPLGSQARDVCGSLGLNHLGVRTVGNADADAERCWAGR